ncbi:MAG: hypothetical protein ABI282_05905 [Candidatus Baltobacteraceae bacterium]
MKAPIGSLVAFVVIAGLAACGTGTSSNGLPQQSPTPVVSGTPGVPATPTPVVSTEPTPPGGGQTPPPVITPTPSPGATATPTPTILTVAGQQLEAQTALTSVSAFSGLVGPDGVGAILPNLTLFTGPKLLHRNTLRPSLSGGCTNGTMLTASPGANGAEVYILQGFYDAGCTQKEYELDATVASYTQDGITEAIVGKGLQTYFDRSQNPVGTTSLDTINIRGLQITPPQVAPITAVVRGTYVSHSGQTTSAFGTTCRIAPGNTVCGNATAMNSGGLGSALGYVLNANLGSSNNISTASITVNGYTGALNSMTVNPAVLPPFWSITGGTAVAQNVVYTPTSSGFTILDPANGAQIAVTVTNGLVSGTISDSGQQFATFQTDIYGLGTITFSDHSTGSITNFIAL